MQIYLARNRVQAGPYTLDQLNKMLATQQVSLDDLMWHEGMAEWARVGDLTNNTHNYNPNDVKQSRPTVDDLYANSSTSSKDAHRTNNKTLIPDKKIKSVSLTKIPSTKVGNNELASVGNRVLATLIDELLVFSAFIPLLSALSFDYQKLFESMQSLEAFMSILSMVPDHLMIMSFIMAIGLIVIQIAMLLKRGQTIGKLAVGVRILDFHTHRVPSAFNLIVIRSILTNLAYKLPFIGIAILMADFAIMVINKQHRSLHDKAAKTYVAKANDSQI